MEAGPLRTEAELNHAARVMLSTLGDPFTQWLPPSRFRWGVQHPGRAEARYVERTRQGPGVVLGEVEEGGGRVVEAVLAESSAEQAGIVMGDRRDTRWTAWWRVSQWGCHVVATQSAPPRAPSQGPVD